MSVIIKRARGTTMLRITGPDSARLFRLLEAAALAGGGELVAEPVIRKQPAQASEPLPNRSKRFGGATGAARPSKAVKP